MRLTLLAPRLPSSPRATLGRVGESAPDFLAREYEHLRKQEGGNFFLAVGSYVNELDRRPETHEVLASLKTDMQAALQRFVDEQTGIVEEAKRIRDDLAERAPEIDNSDMERPDERTHAYTAWDLDSFARFDDLVERDRDLEIGYPLLPDGASAPGVVPQLLQILRGRLREAEYGEDASINDPKIRHDLGEFGRRIGNIGERQRASVQQYLQDSRTLPGLAFARLAHFGSDLVAEPVEIETQEDIERSLERSIREWGNPKTVARKLANGERLEDWEERYGAEIEEALKREAERLHRELGRRLPEGGLTVTRTLTVRPLPITIGETRRLTAGSGDALTFTQFVELILARLYEADRQQPGHYVDLFMLAEELRQDVPDDWVREARDALQNRDLIHSFKVSGRIAEAKLTGEGRLYVEQGGDTGIIDEYKQHPTNFVIVTGSRAQVAVGTGGNVTQTSVQGKVPDEAWELLDLIENEVRDADGLSHQERQDALTDVKTARAQLERPEPNKQAAIAILDPLAKVSSIGSFVAKLGELLA